MIARTTLSLDNNILIKLQKIVKQENIKSLSQMVKGILGQFIESYEKKKMFEIMAKNYQKYSKNMTPSPFVEMEEASLTDLLHRKK